MSEEWSNFKNWCSAPFKQPMPIWVLVALVGAFVVVAFIVYDNLDIITRGYKDVEAATTQAAA